MMKRAVTAAFWIAVAAVPVVLAAVLKFGCCAMPAMPFCHMAAASHDHAQTPAREQQEPVRRIAMPPSSLATYAADEARTFAPTPRTAYRSFISLGATRCDRDVGLNVLLAILLI